MPASSIKATYLEVLKSTLGDSAATTDFETFLKRSAPGGPRNDIARLAGARFVASIEVEDGKALTKSVVKTLTGGDTSRLASSTTSSSCSRRSASSG